MKALLKTLLPRRLLDARAAYVRSRQRTAFQGLSTAETFTRIYREGLWGRSSDPDDGFNSGTGSHAAAVVEPYVATVSAFLAAFDAAPDVVDLGCGDFAVGARLRPFARRYIGCDVVAPLIERNRRRFADLDVDFRVLDMIADNLPGGDVAFVRQVLQHLSNAQIAAVLPKLAATYRCVVVSEHVSAEAGFVANRDKPAGPDIRRGSGVVLTAPPFDLVCLEARELCRVPEEDGTIVTTLYRFR